MNGLKALSFLTERGVEVTMLNETTFEVGGFYKSGTVKVCLLSNTFEARYNEVTEVPVFSNLLEQLIWANEEWQERSSGRFEGWNQLDENWAKVKQDYKELISQECAA
jgi:hypothetical protein